MVHTYMNTEPNGSCVSSDEWVSTLINEARKTNPLVTETALATIELLIKGPLSERKQTPANRKSIARQLIVEMALESPSPEGTQ